jgi:hypothetical protein
MRFIAQISIVLVIVSVVVSCAETDSAEDDVVAGTTIVSISVDAYDRLLHDYVDDSGLVNYAALKDNPAGLDAFVADMGRLDPARFAEWDRDTRLAFWINAYNAITLQRILDHYPIDRGGLIKAVLYPVNSIRQIDGVWTELTSPVLGQPMTLDHIEHEILRKEFDEPRIHAAIVCAAKGCPPLRAEAFRAENINAELDDQCRKFLGAAHRFRVDRDKNVVHLSPILKWFAEDFVAKYSGLGPIGGHDANDSAALQFARQYVDAADADYIANAAYRVQYLDYDWSLNEQP